MLIGSTAYAQAPLGGGGTTVSEGDLTVILPLLAAAGTFYQPTITPGPVTITLPLLESAGAFYPLVVSHVRLPGIRVTVSDSLAQG